MQLGLRGPKFFFIFIFEFCQKEKVLNLFFTIILWGNRLFPLQD